MNKTEIKMGLVAALVAGAAMFAYAEKRTVVATDNADFWLGPGCESCPWAIGEGVTAYIKDRGLYLLGEGEVAEAPWAEYDDMLDGIGQLPRAIIVPASVAATLPVSVETPTIPDDKVLVAKEELQAAKAEAVTVADGVVSLGVTVNTNGNFTAETKSWQPVELKPENVKVENGKIVISIPVDSQSGFMILQSGDAKVGAGNAD